jgi:uncharacterized glyoxalase superfamily protein PhnB
MGAWEIVPDEPQTAAPPPAATGAWEVVPEAPALPTPTRGIRNQDDLEIVGEPRRAPKPPPGRAGSAKDATVRAFMRGISDAPQYASIAMTQGAREMLDHMDEIDQGSTLVDLVSKYPNLQFGRSIAIDLRQYQASDPEQRKALRERFEISSMDPRDRPMYQWGSNLNNAVRGAFPGNPEYADTLFEKFAQGGGSLAFFAAGGIAGRFVKLPSLVTAGALGGTSNGTATFQRALATGASIDVALDATQYGFGIGLTEAIPIARALNRLRRLKGGWKQTALDTAGGAFEEGSQEAIQAVLDQLVDAKILDIDYANDRWSEVGEGAFIGGTLGGLLSFITSAIGGRRARRTNAARDELARQRAVLQDLDERVEPTLPEDPREPPGPAEAVPEERAPDSDFVQRARDIWQERGMAGSHSVDQIEEALKLNVGPAAAAEFRNEWEALRAAEIARRLQERDEPEAPGADAMAEADLRERAAGLGIDLTNLRTAADVQTAIDNLTQAPTPGGWEVVPDDAVQADPVAELHDRAANAIADMGKNLTGSREASDQLEAIAENAPDVAAFEKTLREDMDWLWRILESERTAREEDFGEPDFTDQPPLDEADAGIDVSTRKRSRPRPKAPTTMIQAIRGHGGITDEGGDLETIIGGRPGRTGFAGLRGIINDDGIGADEMAVKLWEDGYFGSIPSANELREAIDEETRGKLRTSSKEGGQQEYDDANVLEERAAQLEIANINLYTIEELATEVQRREAQLTRDVGERLPDEPGATEPDEKERNDLVRELYRGSSEADDGFWDLRREDGTVVEFWQETDDEVAHIAVSPPFSIAESYEIAAEEIARIAVRLGLDRDGPKFWTGTGFESESERKARIEAEEEPAIERGQGRVDELQRQINTLKNRNKKLKASLKRHKGVPGEDPRNRVRQNEITANDSQLGALRDEINEAKAARDEPDTERTDQGEQYVTPGTEVDERTDDQKEIDRRQAEEKATTEAEQKEPGGMFDEDAKRQVDIFDLTEDELLEMSDGEVLGMVSSVWTGSGARYEKYDLDFAGTGEGAHVYGWGGYFGTKRGVAEYYRDTVGGNERYSINGEKIPSGKSAAESMDLWMEIDQLLGTMALAASDKFPNYDPSALISHLRGSITLRVSRWKTKVTKGTAGVGSQADDMNALVGFWIEHAKAAGNEDIVEESAGYLYQAELAPDEDAYLYWDKPLSEQSESVQAAVRAILESGQLKPAGTIPYSRWDDQSRGSFVYTALQANLGSKKAASLALLAEGVPGIKYLDQDSRTKKQAKDTYNYVIFDDRLVTMKERDGEILGREAAVAEEEAFEEGELFEDGKTNRSDTRDYTPGENNPPLLHDSGTETATDKFPGKGYTIWERLFWPSKWRTRQSILVPLLQAEDVRLYQGRIKKGTLLGFYRPGRQEVRIRRQGDIEIAAHELAHLLDDKHPEIREALWNPATNANKVFRAELKEMSYDKENKPYLEGWPEFVRAWATNPLLAAENAPKTYEWFESWLDGYEHGQAWRLAQARMTDWFRQDPLHRLESKVGATEVLNRGRGMPARSRQLALDDLYGSFVMEKKLFGYVRDDGGYMTGRLARGAQAVVGGALKWGAPEWRKGQIVYLDKDGNADTVQVTKNGKPHLANNPNYTPWGLERILKPVVKNLQEFGRYAIARRAEYLRTKGKEKLLSPSEIKAGVALALEHPEYETAFAEWNAFNSQLLDFAQQSGLIDQASRAKWETAVYLPFWRADKSNSNARRRSSSKVIFHLKGGTGNLRDPIENMVENTRLLIENSINNHAKRTILAQTNQIGGGNFAAQLKKEDKRIPAWTWSVRKAVLDGMDMETLTEELGEETAELLSGVMDAVFKSLPGFLEVVQLGVHPKGHDIVSVMVGGKPQFYQVGDELLRRSLQQLPRQVNQNPILRIFRGGRRFVQLTVTFSFDFILRNLVRDQLIASALAKSGYKPYLTAAKGLRHQLFKSPYYRQYIANGGALASFYSDEAHFRSKLKSLYGTRYQRLLNAPMRVMDYLEALGEAAEVSTRLGAFEKAIQAGKSPRRAAFESREISTDFAMRGDNQYLGFLYDSVMFLKAGVVGVDRLYRGLATDEDKGRAWAVTMGIGSVGLGLYILNRLNPLYDDLDDWDKNLHWHFYIPTPEYFAFVRKHGRDPDTVDEAQDLYWHWRKPKPFEIGGFATMMETAFEAIIGDQPKEDAVRSWKALRDMFRFDLVPAIIRPAWDVFLTNNVSFFDVPVESPYQKSLPKWARYTDRNSLLFRDIGQKILRHGPQVVSPAQLEQLLRGYLNTWALYGLMLVDGSFYDRAPDIPFTELPAIRPFYRGKRTTRTREVEPFFKMLEEVRATNRVWQKMRDENEPGIVAELQEQRDRALERRLGRSETRARKIRERRENVINAANLSSLHTQARRIRTRDRAAYRQMRDNADVWDDAGKLRARMIEFWSEQYASIFREAMAKEEERQVEEGESR